MSSPLTDDDLDEIAAWLRSNGAARAQEYARHHLVTPSAARKRLQRLYETGRAVRSWSFSPEHKPARAYAHPDTVGDDPRTWEHVNDEDANDGPRSREWVA